MDISPSEAEKTLASIRETEDQMRKALNASAGGYQMLSWGVVMLIGYTLNQYAEQLSTAVVAGTWIVLSVIANIVSVASSARMAKKFHSPLGARIGAMFPIFILYGAIGAFFVHPASPREINLLVYLLVMLWLAMMGLWVKLSMLWISLIFTGLMLFGYVVLPDYFFLWLAMDRGVQPEALRDAAVEEGVAYVSGDTFFVDRSGSQCIRLAYSFVAEQEIEEAIRRLGRALKRAEAASRPRVG